MKGMIIMGAEKVHSRRPLGKTVTVAHQARAALDKVQGGRRSPDQPPQAHDGDRRGHRGHLRRITDMLLSIERGRQKCIGHVHGVSPLKLIS